MAVVHSRGSFWNSSNAAGTMRDGLQLMGLVTPGLQQMALPSSLCAASSSSSIQGHVAGIGDPGRCWNISAEFCPSVSYRAALFHGNSCGSKMLHQGKKYRVFHKDEEEGPRSKVPALGLYDVEEMQQGTLNADNVTSIVESQDDINEESSREDSKDEWDLFRLQEEDSQEYVTKIPVTRQKYIQVPKVALVSSLLQSFDSKDDESNFLTICSCLESILHSEHKVLLEELRLDGFACSSTRQMEATKNPKNSKTSKSSSDHTNGNGFINTNGVLEQSITGNAFHGEEQARSSNNRTAAAARFQQNIMHVLKNAQFQELSARDLQLSTALNSDYLLTIPINVDWKNASSANVIIFRRGYATEKQEGFLFGAKLDYMQSLVLRQIFNIFAQPLLRAGRFIMKKKQVDETVKDNSPWTEAFRKWLKEPLPPDDAVGELDQPASSSDDLPIWIAARRAVPRYEAVLSGSRGKLLRRLLVWMRILPPESTKVTNLFSDGPLVNEPHLRPNYLTRVSMRDIWLPASKSHSRRGAWKRLQAALSVFFSRSTLQEPAFKELVVMHAKASNATNPDVPDSRLELNTYKNIPVPDLKVVFPNKKLNFRALDTVRLDIATIVGLLAFLVNYRFDDVLSSPSAFVLDIVTTTSLVLFATRVTLGYKQTWDRYQLLVNKTLYEKTLASGFGVVHFLIDASEEQQLKEAILLYALLLQSADGGDMCLNQLASVCERHVYANFKEQIEMPVEDAVAVLSRLGLVVLQEKNSETFIRAVPYAQAVVALETRWQTLLTAQSIWKVGYGN